MKNQFILFFLIVSICLSSCTPVSAPHTWSLSEITGDSEIIRQKMEKISMTTCGAYFAQQDVEDELGQISTKVFVGLRNPELQEHLTQKRYAVIKGELKTIIIENHGDSTEQFAIEDISYAGLQTKYVLYITPEYYEIVSGCVPEPFSKTVYISIS